MTFEGGTEMTTAQMVSTYGQISTRQSDARAEAKATQEELEIAFSKLVDEYSGMAYNLALGMLRHPEDAEDAVQDAFVSAYKSFSRFKGDSKPSTWLYRIVVNSCLMKIRKNNTRSKYFSDSGYDDAVVYDWANDPERAARNGELREAIEAGLSHLSPDLRAAVVLRDIQSLSSEEASAVLNISVAALKSRLHRARTLLRKQLELVWENR
jgi:RNA polymerase sigma-70 factor (ECF subfamily)